MELKIYSPKDDNDLQTIEWNHEEIKAEVTQKVEMYKTLVYTDWNITRLECKVAIPIISNVLPAPLEYNQIGM